MSPRKNVTQKKMQCHLEKIAGKAIILLAYLWGLNFNSKLWTGR
jgi:hypothetical protein